VANREINIVGGKQLAKFLAELPIKIEKNIMRSALRAGAKVVLDEAKANVAVENGDLKSSGRVSTNSKKGRVEASAKFGNKKAWYGRFVEYGTAPHLIKGKNGGMLRFTARDGKQVEIRQVNHTGAKAKPYLRPALDSKAEESTRAVANKIRQRLTEQGINTPDTVAD
jgi:HK97 gp10 family phage protein